MVEPPIDPTRPVPGDGLRGLRVLVTGASRGIGYSVASLLAASGAWVGMVARSESDLVTAAANAGAHPFRADVSSADDVADLGRRVRQALGDAPDAVVNSAGAFSISAVAATAPEQFDQQLAVNLRAPFLVIREFLPRMLERGAGQIVSIGSVAGRTAFPGNGAYSASKFGLRGLHEVLTEEVRGTGVRVTLVEPAATDTALWDPLDPDARADLPSRSSMLRPEEVARAVAFVLSQGPGVEVPLLAIRANR